MTTKIIYLPNKIVKKTQVHKQTSHANKRQRIACSQIESRSFYFQTSPIPPPSLSYLHALPHGSEFVSDRLEVRSALRLLGPALGEHDPHTVKTRLQHMYRRPANTHRRASQTAHSQNTSPAYVSAACKHTQVKNRNKSILGVGLMSDLPPCSILP